jgi:predicted lipid-binding transport protein (Tim44 family)
VKRAGRARALVVGLALAFGLTYAFALGARAAWARPGGGGSFRASSSYHSSSSSSYHSSSSGYSSSSSSSSNGDSGAFGELIGLLFRLCLERPVVGFPVLGAIVALFVLVARARSRGLQGDWATTAPVRAPPEPVRRDLERLRAIDPEFSIILFQDFLYALYAEVQAARGAQQLARLAPWVSPEARDELAALELAACRDVVVGALRFTDCGDDGDFTAVGVELITNFTEVAKDGGEHSFYQREVWRLRRRRDARSRPPEKIRTFGCPNCGAALEALRGNTCTYCKQIIDTGQFDWLVVDVAVPERETRGPMLTGTTEEQGTDLPTIVDRDLAASLNALTARDATFNFDNFRARVALVFAELQVAWSTREWLRARPYVSDSLFQMQLYWIEAYKRAHLRNVTENARITMTELVRVGSDKHYDAITVRLFGIGLDYTVTDGDRKVVGGSKTRERRYSEYWTFIRGSARTGAARADRKCPSCGADVKVNMAGQCEYCKARLSSGEFDWVLSQIEQDEVYSG